ncbi:MAG: hypothetical protein HYR56_24840 [Acidobacteria bacterium]|nr:hypothetical protein [Acidobacteriota bacterium]MBI3428140.1 hypothetical protein [Acidobacteriota bacterium]
MEKPPPAKAESPKPTVSYPPDQKPVLRALKRLVTQSERDEVAGLPAPAAQAQTEAQAETDHAAEGR